MRIAYFFLWRIAKPDGVSGKIRAQVREWKREGHEVLALCLTDELEIASDDDFELVKLDTRHGLWRRLTSEFEVKREVRERFEEFGPDVVYMRQTARGGIVRSIAGCYPVVFEVNADEVSQLELLARQSGKLKHWLRYWWVRLNMGRTYGCSKGIVSVTRSMTGRNSYGRFEKPMVVVPNGIDLEAYGDAVGVVRGDGRGALPAVVFIGGTYAAPWHGIDLILGLAASTVGELDFHVIGTSLEGFDVPENVRSYGYLGKSESREVFGRCDVGLATPALFRNGMDEGCPLKMRDYLAAGLPVILPHAETALLAENGEAKQVDWVLPVPNREDGLSSMRNEIVGFCKQWRGRRVPRAEIQPLIDVRELERKRLKFLQSVASLGS